MNHIFIAVISMWEIKWWSYDRGSRYRMGEKNVKSLIIADIVKWINN